MKHYRFRAWSMVFCFAMTSYAGYRHKYEDKGNDTATNIQEHAEHIMADTKEINVRCKEGEVVGTESGAKDYVFSEETAVDSEKVVTE